MALPVPIKWRPLIGRWWDPWRRDGPAQESVPVEMFEEWVFLDFFPAVTRAAQTLLRVPFQQASDQGSRIFVDVGRDVQRALQYVLVELHLVSCLVLLPEGERSHDELAEAHAHRPPVHGTRVATIQDHLGRDVLGRPHQCVRPVLLLAATEIDKFAVSLLVEEQVFWLEVPVDDTQLMQVVDSQCDGSDVELSLRLGQDANLSDGVKQVAAAQILLQKVYVRVVLEGLDELHETRVVALQQHLPFREYGPLLLSPRHCLFVDALEGVLLAGHSVTHQLDHTDRALARLLEHLQVIQLDVQVLESHPVLECVSEGAHDLLEDSRLQRETRGVSSGDAPC
mmetsp:Transcript_663/g.1377  ORF Transcript_663/g.1377 Transcript_663/m.1377 type:complete len:339 (+) Transcript_663:517-1533(+)